MVANKFTMITYCVCAANQGPSPESVAPSSSSHGAKAHRKAQFRIDVVTLTGELAVLLENGAYPVT
jgi:hypothetical protein